MSVLCSSQEYCRAAEVELPEPTTLRFGSVCFIFDCVSRRTGKSGRTLRLPAAPFGLFPLRRRIVQKEIDRTEVDDGKGKEDHSPSAHVEHFQVLAELAPQGQYSRIKSPYTSRAYEKFVSFLDIESS
ncbi:hypothetical protein WA026_007980 [Henosepilachna vigintioctopunctata]|uniref:Uncharacterized protein n=1 Tax=Henosepilachna vigintioctopunctata TaxID=420089 RepID=A0AAW1TPZ3_9CUCU